MAEASLDAASSTIAYLSFKPLELAVGRLNDETAMQQHIIQGSYVLLLYATQNMVSHVRDCIWIHNIIEPLEQSLLRFITKHTLKMMEGAATSRRQLAPSGGLFNLFFSYLSLLTDPEDVEAFYRARDDPMKWTMFENAAYPGTRAEAYAFLVQFLARNPRIADWGDFPQPGVKAGNESKTEKQRHADWQMIHRFLDESNDFLVALRMARQPTNRKISCHRFY
jgi:hypothetical protein